jgi:hypothetical protein
MLQHGAAGGCTGAHGLDIRSADVAGIKVEMDVADAAGRR